MFTFPLLPQVLVPGDASSPEGAILPEDAEAWLAAFFTDGEAAESTPDPEVAIEEPELALEALQDVPIETVVEDEPPSPNAMLAEQDIAPLIPVSKGDPLASTVPLVEAATKNVMVAEPVAHRPRTTPENQLFIREPKALSQTAPKEVRLEAPKAEQANGKPQPAPLLNTELATIEHAPPALAVDKAITSLSTPPQPIMQSVAQMTKVPEPVASSDPINAPMESETLDHRVITRVEPTRAAPASAPVVRQIVEHMAVALRETNNGVTEIRLSPEELGRVRMALQPSDAGVHVVITAERAEVGDMLRRNIDQLEQDLNALGYEDISFSFEQSNDETEHDSESVSDPDTSEDVVVVAQPRRIVHPGTLDLKL